MLEEGKIYNVEIGGDITTDEIVRDLKASGFYVPDFINQNNFPLVPHEKHTIGVKFFKSDCFSDADFPIENGLGALTSHGLYRPTYGDALRFAQQYGGLLHSGCVLEFLHPSFVFDGRFHWNNLSIHHESKPSFYFCDFDDVERRFEFPKMLAGVCSPGIDRIFWEPPSIRESKVLVVEDNFSFYENWRRKFNGRAELILASSAWRAQSLFEENPDLALIAMDGHVDDGFTFDLVKDFRTTFKGPMIAISGEGWICRNLKSAGCDHVCEKENMPRLALDLLKFF